MYTIMKKFCSSLLIFCILISFPISAAAKGINSESEQKIYNDIRLAVERKETSVNLGYYVLQADDKETQEELVRIFRQVLCDNPLYFYVKENTIRLSVINFLGIKFVGLMKFEIDYDTYNIQKMTKKLKEEITNAKNYVEKKNAATDYEIIETLYDYLITTVKYDTELQNVNNNNAYGALVDKNAVCYGYAKAYILLLKSYGIKSDIAYSEKMEHAWAVINYRDNWYNIDPTWDSQFSSNDNISHNNFLKSDDEFKQLGHYSWFSNVACDKAFVMPTDFFIIKKTDLSPNDFIFISRETRNQKIYRILFSLKKR